MTDQKLFKVAVLDDFQAVARQFADWTEVERYAELTVFTDHVADADALASRLAPFDVICVMRERTPLPGALLARLPKLRLIVSTGPRNASIDQQAADSAGIAVMHTGYIGTPAIELTWALILASARDIVDEATALRTGGWQQYVGVGLAGKTLGILGLGNIGSEVARIGRAFNMDVIAWSPNLTQERARLAGVEMVSREDLFANSDFLSVHLVLSPKTQGLVSGSLIDLMKPTARLINTARGPILDEAALVSALRENRIGGAALDVFDEEPLPLDHPFRSTPRLIATPHIGYVSQEQYEIFYEDTASAVADWLSGE